jgi:predicted GNAT family acetyltransferase
MTQTIEVRHAPERSRYEISLDGQVVGFADYRTADDALVFSHTIIDNNLRGQGLGDRLVQEALDDVRRRGERVVPRCWFVAEFIDAHPEYKELRAA